MGDPQTSLLSIWFDLKAHYHLIASSLYLVLVPPCTLPEHLLQADRLQGEAQAASVGVPDRRHLPARMVRSINEPPVKCSHREGDPNQNKPKCQPHTSVSYFQIISFTWV